MLPWGLLPQPLWLRVGHAQAQDVQQEREVEEWLEEEQDQQDMGVCHAQQSVELRWCPRPERGLHVGLL